MRAGPSAGVGARRGALRRGVLRRWVLRRRVLRGRRPVRVWVGGPVPPGADAITLGPLIIVRRAAAADPWLLAHERVHVRQWAELGMVRFLWRYVGAYLRWRLAGYGHWAAYRRIPLEVEAEWEVRRAARTAGAGPLGSSGVTVTPPE